MAQQIRKKFIGNDQVGADQLKVESGKAVRAMDGATEVELIKVSSSEVFVKGYKLLESSGLIDANRLPSFVDDVLEFADLASFPVSGETGKIYVALDTNKQYRWSGSTYVQITSGAVDSVNGETGIVVLTAGDIGLDSAVNGQTDVQSSLEDHETRLDDAQNEIDAIETGAGLNTDGTYSANGFSPIISAATSLKNADDYLDLALQNVITLSGVALSSQDLGSFSGSTIADNQTIKSAIQDLETAHEAHLNDSSDAHDASAISFSNGASGLVATDVQAAIDEVESRVQSLEEALQPTWARVKFDLSAADISNGYVNLAHEAIGESIHAFVDRLAIHQGEDFTISVVGGVTRITFAGDLVSPGQSQLDASDNIYVRYQHLA